MICSHCQTPNAQGTVLCNQCLMPLEPTPASPAPLPRPLMAAAAPQHPQIRWLLLDNLQPTGQSLKLPDLSYNGEILLGRTDLREQIIVDIDLSTLGGYEKKVSRRHARLTFDQGQVFLEDWDSQFGTYVNKTKLEKLQKQVLKANDEIRLAQLVFKMEVV